MTDKKDSSGVHIWAGVTEDGRPFLHMSNAADAVGLSAGLDGPAIRQLVAQLLSAFPFLPPASRETPGSPLLSADSPRWQIARTDLGKIALTIFPLLLPEIVLTLSAEDAAELATELLGEDA